MSENAESPTQETPRRGKAALKWALVLLFAAGFGGGGFALARTGIAADMLAGSPSAETGDEATAPAPWFMELEPIVVTIGGADSLRQLRFRAFLEIAEAAPFDVLAVRPRIMDIFATYLRAVPLEELEDPAALLRIRAQMLRRVQLLAGPDSVRDLLVLDFVIT